MRNAIFGIVLFSGLGLLGCTHSLHVSDLQDIQPSIHSKSARRIKAESEQFTVLGFVTQTDYVDKAYEDLMRRCPNGEITGITTRFSTSHGFFSWTNRIKMSAWCI